MKFSFNKSLLGGVILAASFGVSSIYAEVAVVVHPGNSTAKLTKSEVKRIFLGKSRKFPNGEKAIPIDQGAGTKSRANFYSSVVKKTESQLKSYWSRIIFTGKGQPPRQEGDDGSVKKLVSSNPNLIGYMDAGSVDGSVKVLLKVN